MRQRYFITLFIKRYTYAYKGEDVISSTSSSTRLSNLSGPLERSSWRRKGEGKKKKKRNDFPTFVLIFNKRGDELKKIRSVEIESWTGSNHSEICIIISNILPRTLVLFNLRSFRARFSVSWIVRLERYSNEVDELRLYYSKWKEWKYKEVQWVKGARVLFFFGLLLYLKLLREIVTI